MNKTRVYLLDSGSIQVDSHIIFWNEQGHNAPYRFPVYSVLVEHDEGLLLFDTGIDNVMASDDPNSIIYQTKQQTLAGQLDLIGYKPSDISLVMNSHYHFDHIGGNKLCTCATTVCHKHEMEHFLNPHPATEAPGYLDRSFLEAHGNYKPKFEMVTGDQEVAKGVTLFETPGHTAGHYSLMVRLAERRPMIFTGDACYSQRNMDLMTIPSLHDDPRKAYASLERLKALALEQDAELFYSHDKENYSKYKKAPGFYC